MSGKQSAAMDKAERLVTTKSASPAEAARQVGIAVQSIYRAAWYKAYKAAETNKRHVANACPSIPSVADSGGLSNDDNFWQLVMEFADAYSKPFEKRLAAKLAIIGYVECYRNCPIERHKILEEAKQICLAQGRRLLNPYGAAGAFCCADALGDLIEKESNATTKESA